MIHNNRRLIWGIQIVFINVKTVLHPCVLKSKEGTQRVCILIAVSAYLSCPRNYHFAPMIGLQYAVCLLRCWGEANIFLHLQVSSRNKSFKPCYFHNHTYTRDSQGASDVRTSYNFIAQIRKNKDQRRWMASLSPQNKHVEKLTLHNMIYVIHQYLTGLSLINLMLFTLMCTPAKSIEIQLSVLLAWKACCLGCHMVLSSISCKFLFSGVFLTALSKIPSPFQSYLMLCFFTLLKVSCAFYPFF